MDFDHILVMDDGAAAEFGSPHDLLFQPNGRGDGGVCVPGDSEKKSPSLFAELVDSAGPEAALYLRTLATKTTG